MLAILVVSQKCCEKNKYCAITCINKVRDKNNQQKKERNFTLGLHNICMQWEMHYGDYCISRF